MRSMTYNLLTVDPIAPDVIAAALAKQGPERIVLQGVAPPGLGE